MPNHHQRFTGHGGVGTENAVWRRLSNKALEHWVRLTFEDVMGRAPSDLDVGDGLWFLVGKHWAGEDTKQRSFAEYERHLRASAPSPPPPGPSPTPTPSPPGPIPPVTLGDWSSDFLLDGPDVPFFGPAVFARPEGHRIRYYQALRARGFRWVVLNAQQADWGPSKGKPQWTAGGWDWLKQGQLPPTVSRIEEARREGLHVCLGVIDQPQANTWKADRAKIFESSQRLVDATAHLVGLYLTTWEGDEVWTHGDVREPLYVDWIKDVDWKGIDVGIHFSSDRRGEIQWYERLERAYSGHVVQLMQYGAGSTDAQLREQTWERRGGSPGMAKVAHLTGVKFCCFEHSSSVNQQPTWPERDHARRRQVILEAASRARLPADRIGFLN